LESFSSPCCTKWLCRNVQTHTVLLETAIESDFRFFGGGVRFGVMQLLLQHRVLPVCLKFYFIWSHVFVILFLCIFHWGHVLVSVHLPSVRWRCWLGGRKGIRPVTAEWWGADMVICLEQGADLHMAQLMPLPLIVSCSSKIQIGFTFLVPAHLGSPR